MSDQNNKSIFKQENTNRGWDKLNFTDRYGSVCSLQKSSLATEDAIWLGVEDATPKIMAAKAIAMGRGDLTNGQTTGWVPFPVPDDVLLTTRMHLTVEQVKDLIPVLQLFVESGEITEGTL